MFKKQIYFLFFLSAAFFAPLPALAWSVSPLKYTLNVDPGGSQIAVITVKNDQIAPAKFTFFVSGVKQDQLGRSLLQNKIDVAEAWVKPQITGAVLKPGEQIKINFVISVPVGAAPGEHDLALVAEQTPAAGQVGLGGALAVPLILRVAGVVTESVAITAFKSVQAIIFNQPKTNLVLSLQNRGTVAAPVGGRLLFSNWLGQSFGSQDLYLGNALFPQTSRQLTLSAHSAGWFWPGPYTAKLTVNYGSAGLQGVGQVIIWYLPVWSVAAAVGLILLASIIILKKFKKKSANSAPSYDL